MRHNELRASSWTMLQPALLEEASILTATQVFEETDRAWASEGATAQKIMPSTVRNSELDKGEYSFLTFFARVLIWGSRNSRAE
jgi:hypothetical protein